MRADLSHGYEGVLSPGPDQLLICADCQPILPQWIAATATVDEIRCLRRVLTILHATAFQRPLISSSES